MKKRTKIILAAVIVVMTALAVVDYIHQTNPAPQPVEYKNPNFPEF